MTPRSALPEAAQYAARANAHRPTCPRRIAAEVRRLAGEGLAPRDIERCLRLGPADVRAALRGAP